MSLSSRINGTLRRPCGTSNSSAPPGQSHSYRQVRQALSPYLFETEVSPLMWRTNEKLIQAPTCSDASIRA
jgi:hypothetical protein